MLCAAVCLVGGCAAAPPPTPEFDDVALTPVPDTPCKVDRDCSRRRICEGEVCVAAEIDETLEGRIRDGDVGWTVLRVVTVTKDCRELPGLNARIEALRQGKGMRKFASELVEASDRNVSQAVAFARWLILLDKHLADCRELGGRSALPALAERSRARLSEREVEATLKEKACDRLRRIERLGLWPYEHRFAAEVAKLDFHAAETTRRIWLDSLADFQKSCTAQMSRRESVSLQVSVDKLQRVVGLDDDMLIALRTKLMAAMERGDANETALLLSAVTERERALDARNAALYEAKMAAIQNELEATRKNMAAAEAAAKQAGRRDESAQRPENALDDVNSALDSAQKAVETVNVARKIFGF